MTPRIVVSGFEAFGAHASNPTADAMRAFAADAALSARARFVILPVTYGGAAALLAAHVTAEQASGCLMFGLAGLRSVVAVERCAYNTMDVSLADNAGVTHGGVPVRVGGPAEISTEGPVDAVVAALAAAGAPAEHSVDPGRFVCNATYYRALAAAMSRVAPVFVHVPATRAQGGAFDEAAVRAWMRAAVAGYVAAVDEATK